MVLTDSARRLPPAATLLGEIPDNGDSLPADYQTGVGVSAMPEQAAELGGSCVVESLTAGGAGLGPLACGRGSEGRAQ